MNERIIAVDIGATNLRVAECSLVEIIRKLQEKTDRDNGPMGVSQQIIRMIKSLDIKPISIGIGSIGPLDLKKGSIVNTPNFVFKNIPVVELLLDEFHIPVKMLNDCATGVLGEWKYGAGKTYENVVYITLSTGLGGGAIVDGHLLIGKDGNAVEIGHITIDPDSSLICGCGCRGHWEAYCGGSHMGQLSEYVLGKDIKQFKKRFGVITAEKVFNLAKTGDANSSKIVEEYGRVNTIGFADVVNVYDPEVLTVGGSIALNNPELVITPILEHIDNHLINRKPKIMTTPLGEDVTLYGALALALRIRSKIS